MARRHRDSGQMIPRGANKWLLRIFLGKRPDGKRLYSSKTVEGTTSDARMALTAMLRAKDTQTFVRASPVTVSEYLKNWLVGKIDVTPRTRVSYRTQLQYAIEALGHHRLTELDRNAIQEYVGELMARQLSPRSIEYAYRILSCALNDAIKNNLIIRNPADYVKLPPKVRRAPSVLTAQQLDLLLEANSKHALCPLWRLLLTSGLRPGEALALKWTDLDEGTGQLSVQRTLVDDGTGKCSLVDSTKTDGSIRSIGLPMSTVASLRKHKAEQRVSILKGGPRYTRSDLMFPNSLGNPMDHNAVRRQWKAALKATKMPNGESLLPIRLYDTRHTHLTGLLQLGADISWIAARAGHKDIKMTQQHYAHVLPETHKQMGEMAEQIVQQAAAARRELKLGLGAR